MRSTSPIGLARGDPALRFHERAQPGHGLRMELVDAGLADAQYLANLLESEPFEVVKRDNKALALGELVHAGGHDATNLPALDLARGVAALVHDQLHEVDMVVAVAGRKDVVETVDVGPAHAHHE